MGTEAFTWYYTRTSLRIDYAWKFLCLMALTFSGNQARRQRSASHIQFSRKEKKTTGERNEQRIEESTGHDGT